MLKPIAFLALLALWSSSYQQGCSDLKKSLTHLSYYPIRDMRQTIAIDPQRTTWGAPDSLTVPTIRRDPYVDDVAPYDVARKKLVAPESSKLSVARGDRLRHTNFWTTHPTTMAGKG